MRAIIAAIFVLLAGSAWAEPPFIGMASVIDGDTIHVEVRRPGGSLLPWLTETIKVRLWGIDAPEYAQKCHAVAASGSEYQCGRDATAALAALLRDLAVTCQPKDRDRYGRTVASCSRDGADIGASMVRQGWAIDYTRYSHGRYAAEQEAAKAENLGMWSGRFEMPEDWRRRNAHDRHWPN